MTKSVKNKLAAGIIKGDLLELKDQMDYTEYGGACLFGLESPVIKAHGSSNANAVYHAIRQAFDIVKNDVTGTIKANITEQNG